MKSSTIAILIMILTFIVLQTDKFNIAVVITLSAICMGLFIPEMKLSDIYAGFASTTVMMVIGMSIVGSSIFKTGISDKIGYYFSKTSLIGNERFFNVVVVISCLIMSSFLSNSGTIAMWIPIIVACSKESNNTIKVKHIGISAAIACSVGGAGTLVGSTSQQQANAILVNMTNGEKSLSLFSQTPIMLVLFVVTIIYFGTFGYTLTKKVVVSEKSSSDFEFIGVSELDKKIKFVPWKAKLSFLIIIFCIIGFVLSSFDFIKPYINIGVISIFAACLLFLTGCLSFKETMQDLDWTTIVVLGFAQALALGVNVSGAGQIIAEFVVNIFVLDNNSIMPLMIVGILLTIFLTNFMSNTVIAAVMTTIYINVAFYLDIDPTPFVIVIGAISSNIACATPIGTPACTQALCLGYRFNDYIKIGGPLCIILAICIILMSVALY